MPNNKLKILRLIDIFNNLSDQNHHLTINDLVEHLNSYGINCERKSLYNDIECLKEWGMDIERVKGSSTGYYLASRNFEITELKLLVDAVLASRFITVKKSRDLTRKLAAMASDNEAHKLNRQILVNENIKSINENIYYSIDKLQSAIQDDKQVSFKYFDIDVDKAREFRNGGERYFVSPYSLVWTNDLYYLIGFYGKYDKISHFRVDRMHDVEPTVLPRVHEEGMDLADMKSYLKTQFQMFSGETERVRIRFDLSLINPIIDKFGMGVLIEEHDDTSFVICERIAVSPTFFGWVMQFGTKAKIIGPPNVVEQIKKFAYDIYENT